MGKPGVPPPDAAHVSQAGRSAKDLPKERSPPPHWHRGAAGRLAQPLPLSGFSKQRKCPWGLIPHPAPPTP